MQDYGKIIFYTDKKYCEIIIKSNKINLYKLNKKDSLMLIRILSTYNKRFNFNQINNNIYINLTNINQLNLLINIFDKHKLKPHKQRMMLNKINKYIGRILVTAALLKIMSPGLILVANDYDNSQNDYNVSSLDDIDNFSGVQPEIVTSDDIVVIDDDIVEDNAIGVEEEAPSETVIQNDAIEGDTELEVVSDSEVISEEVIEEDTTENDEELEIVSNNNTETQDSFEEDTVIESQDEEVAYQTFNDTFNIKDVGLEEWGYEKYNTTVSYYYELFEKYGNMYGIDPNLLSYIATQESGIHEGVENSGGAIGLCQHQVYWTELDVLTRNDLTLDEKIQAFTIKAYNFETNSYDELLPISNYSRSAIDSAKLEGKILIDLSNVDDNIRLAAAKVSCDLSYFDGKAIPTIVSYNQGRYGTDKYIKNYASNNGISYEEALNSTGWLSYISGVGDPDYIYHVLRFAIASEVDSITCSYLDENNNKCDVILNIEGDNIVSNKSISH